jgi:acetolactate synthase-1/3 small subunit
MLVKIGADEQTRPAVIEVAGIFRSRIVDVSPSTITIEATGDMEKLNGLLLLLRPYGILELARTGLVALERGRRVLEVPVSGEEDPPPDGPYVLSQGPVRE